MSPIPPSHATGRSELPGTNGALGLPVSRAHGRFSSCSRASSAASVAIARTQRGAGCAERRRMNTRYCCICTQPGHHSHECPDGPAFRQQWHAPQPQPAPVVVEDDGDFEEDE